MSINQLTITQAHKGLIKKEFSCVELTRACLDRIRKVDTKIKAFLTVTDRLALEQAKKVDEKITRREKIGPLEGIPVAIKDNILVDNILCTAGSKILGNYVAPYDATVVNKLKKVGAVIVGKTNLDEFAMGSSTENSAFGPTKNPHDLTRVPGGSSGGSTAAVAANECIYALGSDTGGSIRQPASFCGVVGLKPTYGLVSRYGLIAMASSLDQIGPITKTVEDVALVLQVISGKDEFDSTSVNPNSKFFRFHRESPTESRYSRLVESHRTSTKSGQIPNSKQIKNLRIGVPREYFGKGLDPGVKRVVKEAIEKISKIGARVEDIKLPHAEYALPCYYIIMPAEVSANLARYDGVKYGHSARAESLLGAYLKTRQEGFGNEARRRIILGTYVLSAGYYEAYYGKAQKVRTLIRQDFEKAFKGVDVLLTPTSPAIAFKIGEKADPLAMYLSDIYTVSVNLAGLPAISIPCGKVDNLPVGLQVIGRQFDEETIFRVAEAYEQAS